MNKAKTVIMAMIVALATIGTLGFAAATQEEVDVTVSIGDGEGNVTIPIMIENVTNLGSCNIRLDFDQSVVSVTDVTDGDMSNMISNIHAGWVRIVAFQTGSTGLNGDVIVANVTFTPVDGCSNATSDLNITVMTLKDATPQGQVIPRDIDNGVYTSIYVGGLNGDASNDGIVDIHDALYIASYVAGITGYDIVCPAIADVDGNGYVDIADASYLASYIAGDPDYDPLQ